MIKFDSTKIGILSFACGLLCTGLVGYFCYDAGYDHGKAEAEAMQSAAVANAQRKVKQDYEIQIKELTASLERVRNDNAKRLRELNDFNNARTDLATCRRERGQLARMAVRGEELLKRADSYLEALK